MKTNLLFKTIASLLLYLLGMSLALAQPTAPSGKKWQAVDALTDDFNTFNTNKWRKGHPYWNGREPSQYNDNNVSVGGGLLRMQMTVKNANQSGNWIWASCVTSKTTAFKPGMYSEARVKNANLSAVTAFWMQGKYSEIDVIENYGTVKNNKYRYLDYTMMSNTHYFAGGWANDKITPKHYTNPNNERNADRYHTYGVWWESPTKIHYYHDGVYQGTATPAGNFSEPMYMFFDMEPFTWGPGLPTVNDLYNGGLNSSYFDFVKTYELVNSGGGSGGSKVALKGNNNKYVSSGNGTQNMTCDKNSIAGWEKFTITTVGTSSAGNAIVTLQGSNGQYVSSENGNGGMNCNRSAVGGWEKFELFHHGNQVYSLKNNGKFMSSENGSQAMTCNRTSSANATEKFTIVWGQARLDETPVTEATQLAPIGVYPNPIKGAEFMVNLGVDNGASDVRIFTLDGRQIFNMNSDAASIAINSGVFPAKGVYVLKVNNESGLTTQRIQY